jgi:hypothetical protein
MKVFLGFGLCLLTVKVFCIYEFYNVEKINDINGVGEFFSWLKLDQSLYGFTCLFSRMILHYISTTLYNLLDICFLLRKYFCTYKIHSSFSEKSHKCHIVHTKHTCISATLTSIYNGINE